MVRHPNNSIRNVLIVRSDRLGDVVLTLPMAAAIKTADRSTTVSFLVNDYTREIVERSPDVNRVISITGEEGLIRLASIMRKSKLDAVFIPSPRFNLTLAAFLAAIPVRVGTAYRWYSFLFNRRVKAHRREGKYHETEHNLRMLSEIGIEVDQASLPVLQLKSDDHIRVDDFLIQNFGKTSARYAVLHIPTRGSSKDWSRERFVELAKNIETDFGVRVVLTGTDSDRATLEAIQQQIPKAKLFAGYSLAELAALLSRAKLVIANSTGPGHLAAVLGTPSVGLFPLPRALAKERWGFRGPHVRNISASAITDCPNCNNCSCMERIMVADVMNEVRDLITKNSDRTSIN